MNIEIPGSFFGLMFLIFMTLKLTNTIDWSWWLVTAPLWGPLTLFILIFLLLICLALIMS